MNNDHTEDAGRAGGTADKAVAIRLQTLRQLARGAAFLYLMGKKRNRDVGTA